MLNTISIMGRLTQTPALKYTQSNKPVLSFSIANEYGFGDNKETYFIDCVAWNKTAEFIANYFDRGDMIILSGTLKTRKWQDQNGQARKATEVMVLSVDFGNSRKEPSQDEQRPPKPPEVTTVEDPSGDDDTALPFDISSY